MASSPTCSDRTSGPGPLCQSWENRRVLPPSLLRGWNEGQLTLVDRTKVECLNFFDGHSYNRDTLPSQNDKDLGHTGSLPLNPETGGPQGSTIRRRGP